MIAQNDKTLTLNFSNSTLRNSLFITVVVYVIAFIVLGIVNIDFNKLPNLYEININFRKYEKEIVKQVKIQNISRKHTPKAAQKSVPKIKISKSEITSKTDVLIEEIDSSLFMEVDTLRNNSNWFDSIVVNNPNLLMLKYVLADQLKNNSYEISDSGKIVKRIKGVMQDYYRSKYPTPVHKFGDGSPGIAIDKILDIFRGTDTVDVEKIKKYLKIGKYK